MADEEAREKWDRRYADKPAGSPEPAQVLLEYAYLLPGSGTALELACGRGGSALFLARRGLRVHAWDISRAAIEELDLQVETENLEIETRVRDVHESPPPRNAFDVICVSYYLERSIVEPIIQALKPRGLLFYQTFIHEKVTDLGPSNPLYRLKSNELLELFAPLHVLVYQELGCVGDTRQGARNVAWLVAQRRGSGSS